MLYKKHGGRSDSMKANIHPETKEATVTCACGETFTTKSTKESIPVEVCSKCHPAYNKDFKSVNKKTGNIDKFNRKYGLEEK